MKKTTYYIDSYIRCGEMPLYLISYRTLRGARRHCVMLCSFRNLRRLLRQRRGFTDPAQYGQVLYSSRAEASGDALRYMLKERFDFNIEHYEPHSPEPHLF